MITLKTIARFLMGKRDAIEAIASSKCLFLALLFMISAGLARNYDHHLLTKEFIWIAGPIGMTLFSSVFIYGFIKIFGKLKSLEVFANYLAFLRCFAMTAPLAWLYGIPFEQFSTALAATQFNFAILLLVSLWRLALMIRVLIVLFNFTPLRAFCLISIPASAEMLVATMIKSINIVGIMGGMKLNTAERFLYEATQTVTVGSFFLLIATCLLIFFSKRGEIRALPPVESPPEISKPTWIAASVIIAMWLVAAVAPQQRLRNLHQFQTLIGKKHYEEAQLFAESLTPADFPPHRRLLGKTTHYTCPLEAEILVHHTTWPDWVRAELDESVEIWLEDLNAEKEDYRINELRERFHEAPHIEKFADRFTPGYTLKIDPSGKNSKDQSK